MCVNRNIKTAVAVTIVLGFLQCTVDSSERILNEESDGVAISMLKRNLQSPRQWVDPTAITMKSKHVSESGAEDTIHIKISDYLFAGVYGTCEITFIDESGAMSSPIELPERWHETHNSFQQYKFIQDQTHTFKIKYSFIDLEKINRIKIVQKSILEAAYSVEWNVELITVNRALDGSTLYFPINRWMNSGDYYKFGLYDAFLPRNDPFRKERKRQLAVARDNYAIKMRHKNVWPLVPVTPRDEGYTGEFLLAMSFPNLVQGATDGAENIGAPSKIDSYQEMIEISKNGDNEPLYANMRFLEDEWFARQRLQGPNSEVIRMAEYLPANFGVQDADVKDLMNGRTLQQALDDGLLFIVDYKIMKDIGDKNITVQQLPAPIALFYLNESNYLNPIAIQLLQDAADDNPVFTPKDPPGKWLLAKFWFQVADATYQQAVSHLGLAHYLIESITAVTHRTLSQSHPVFKLLKPHMLYTIAANQLADQTLTPAGGFVDKALAVTGPGLVYLASLGILNYNMTTDGIVPNVFKERKTAKLFDYAYRDDMMRIHKITRRYVTSVLRIYYKNKKDLGRDKELLTWRKELSASWDCENGEGVPDGIGIKGIPGDDRMGFITVNDLIDTVTCIIMTATARHTATNFVQYDWYAFVPNQPSFMNGKLPTDKNDVGEREILDALPNRNMILKLKLLVNTLSTRKSKSLGDFEVTRLYHPKARKAHKKFRDELDTMSKDLIDINEKRRLSYPHLDPAIIPNSITI